MSKIKFVFGMSVVVALFAFTASPALARFTNHGGKGSGRSGEGVFTYEGGIIKCASAEGTYKVNSEGTELTAEGGKFNKCKALGLEATVACAISRVRQFIKEGTERGKGTGTQASSECVIKTTGCEITAPMEGNKELETISLEKSGTNVGGDSGLKGITATAKGGSCALGGITKEKTTSATLKVPGEVAEGVGLE